MNKKIVISISIITLVIIASIFTLKILKKNNANKEINTQTYTNKFYNYTIKYPSNWYIYTDSSEKDFTQRGDGDTIGGDTTISNYPNLFDYNLENPAPENLFSINYMVYKVKNEDTYDNFLSYKHYDSDCDIKKNIKINNKDALQLICGSNSKDSIDPITYITFVKDNDKMYVFNYNYRYHNTISEETNNIAKNIIYSFILN